MLNRLGHTQRPLVALLIAILTGVGLSVAIAQSGSTSEQVEKRKQMVVNRAKAIRNADRSIQKEKQQVMKKTAVSVASEKVRATVKGFAVRG